MASLSALGAAEHSTHVVDALAAVEVLDGLHDIVDLPDVDDVIGAEFEPDLQPVVARAGEDDGMRPHRLGDRDTEQPDRTGTGHHHALARDQTAEFGQAVHRGAGGDDQRRFLVRHLVRDRHQRVDVVDLIFAEAAVGGEAVGAMALVDVAIVQAVVVTGGVHPLAAALALSAAGMNFHRHALADPVFVDAGAKRHDGAHIFVTGREILVERIATLNRGGRTVIDNLEIGRADRDCIDAHQHLGPLRYRYRLLAER